MFPPYTKTFGGKIWKKLHSVSPDNFFNKNFEKALSLNFSRQENSTYTILNTNWRKKFDSERSIFFTQKFVFKMVYSMMISW